MKTISDLELVSALKITDEIIEENGRIDQKWLNGIRQQKLAIVPISVLRILHGQAQVEAIYRGIWQT